MKIACVVVCASLIASVAASGQSVPTDNMPPSKAAAVCMNCHGPRGDSTRGDVPRLNAQQEGYLRQRLKDLRDPGSQDPHTTAVMWSIVQQADEQTLAELAQYYAKQQPTPPKPDGALALKGKKLYEQGDPAGYMPSCQGCHGASGEGGGNVPRLAGQHGLYLTNQLERLRLGLRASDTMHPKLISITDDQIKALVAYLAND